MNRATRLVLYGIVLILLGITLLRATIDPLFPPWGFLGIFLVLLGLGVCARSLSASCQLIPIADRAAAVQTPSGRR